MPKEDIPIDSSLPRTNYKIISSSIEPVFTSSNSVNNPSQAIAQTDLAQAYAKIGQHFTANTGIVSVGTSTYLALQMQISNYGKSIYINTVRAGSSSTSAVSIGQGSLTGGTAVTVNKFNTKLGVSASTVTVTAFNATTPSFTNLLYVYLLAGGTAELDFNGRLIIPSGSTVTLVISSQNTGAASNNGLISLSWWEA